MLDSNSYRFLSLLWFYILFPEEFFLSGSNPQHTGAAAASAGVGVAAATASVGVTATAAATASVAVVAATVAAATANDLCAMVC